MKKTKNLFLLVLAIMFFANLTVISGKAQGPLDGEIVDGSLLTSDESAFDEKPLILQNSLEGDIIPGEITFFRLQSNADAELTAYVAEGEVLPVATRSFGSIGIFAIPEMGRFYRHVLIEGRYPHHGAVAFGHFGKSIANVFNYLGVKEIGFNQPKGMLYKTENPFK